MCRGRDRERKAIIMGLAGGIRGAIEVYILDNTSSAAVKERAFLSSELAATADARQLPFIE